MRTMHKTDVKVEQKLDNLVTLLGDLRQLHRELLQTASNNLEAMRRSDRNAMDEINRRSEFLTARIARQEQLRRHLAREIAGALDISGSAPDATSNVTVSALAERTSEPRRGQLLVLASEIRALAEETGKTNRICSMVAEQVLRRLGEIRSAMQNMPDETSAYSASGQRRSSNQTRIIEVMG